ncbi:ABC transporter permease [Tersicoccus sp. MR15.9]|uniref:ABC transporter permease n=1 Tax=Tersicoccus mangrovi TaxID=3121635 RepID=UPI002FE5F69A
MTWVAENAPYIAQLTGIHLVQSILPLIFGLIVSIPIAQLARLSRPVSTVILSASSILYTIPSLALFIILPVVLGTGVLDLTNVIVALTIYAVALLVRSCVDAFGSVDDTVRQAAVAVGYTPVRRFFTVDLPLSIPVLIAGLRVVSVSNISLVSVGAVIGIPSLGLLFTDGLQRDFMTPLITGIVITLLLALVMDAILVLIERALTPWTRARKAVGP